MLVLQNVARWHGEKAMKAYDNLRYEKNNARRAEYERTFFRHLYVFDRLMEAA